MFTLSTLQRLQRATAIEKGEAAGHPFRGNKYTKGIGFAERPVPAAKTGDTVTLQYRHRQATHDSRDNATVTAVKDGGLVSVKFSDGQEMDFPVSQIVAVNGDAGRKLTARYMEASTQGEGDASERHESGLFYHRGLQSSVKDGIRSEITENSRTKRLYGVVEDLTKPSNGFGSNTIENGRVIIKENGVDTPQELKDGIEAAVKEMKAARAKKD